MVFRYAALALLVLALGAPSASAQKLNYLKQIIDVPALVPPPPAPGSEAFKEDLAGVIEAQENRTEERMRRAVAQKVLTIYHFSEVLGPKFTAQNLPVMDAFFKRMHEDQRASLISAKNVIQRQRPFLVSKDVQALAGQPRLPTGYPSGGTIFIQSTATLLGQMIPEKRLDLHESAREYNLTRIMIGEHFPRDVRAGEMAAAVIVYALTQVPEFKRDFEAARAELRQALGYPAEPATAGSAPAK
jgi:hypothetical protein